jgi:hypothetical protein
MKIVGAKGVLKVLEPICRRGRCRRSKAAPKPLRRPRAQMQLWHHSGCPTPPRSTPIGPPEQLFGRATVKSQQLG